MKKILVIHGPNLGLLGKRQPRIYGKVTLKEINDELRALAKKNRVALDVFQSNSEGEIVDLIGKSRDKYGCLLINPAAYTHTSVAIRDAVSASGIPAIEVHLSNIYSREEFRHTSLIAPVARGQICGFGKHSYILGFSAAMEILKSRNK